MYQCTCVLQGRVPCALGLGQVRGPWNPETMLARAAGAAAVGRVMKVLALDSSMVQKLEQQLIDTPLIPRTLDKLAISSEARNTKSWCSDSLTLLQTSQAAAELEMNSSCDVEKRGGKIDEQNIEGRLPLHERARLYRISLETQPGNKDPKIYHQHAHMIYGVDIG